jgi:tetratricopeptide (TPR) repeat protein
MRRSFMYALGFTVYCTCASATMADDCFYYDPDHRDIVAIDRNIEGCTGVIEFENPEHHALRAKAYHRRGVAYYEKGEVDQAIADFDQAIELVPNDAAVFYYDRGVAYIKIGNEEKAIADFRKALEIGHGSSDAAAQLEALGVTP